MSEQSKIPQTSEQKQQPTQGVIHTNTGNEVLVDATGQVIYDGPQNEVRNTPRGYIYGDVYQINGEATITHGVDGTSGPVPTPALENVSREQIREHITYLISEIPELQRSFYREAAALQEQRTRAEDALARLERSVRVVQMYADSLGAQPSLYESFKEGALKEAVADIANGVRVGNDLLRESGLLYVIEHYFDDIIAGMRAEDFPEEDIAILQRLGTKNPRATLAAVVYLLKTRRQFVVPRNIPIGQQLKRVASELPEHYAQVGSAPLPPPPLPGDVQAKRRWFKGLAGVGEGAAMLILNVGLAASIFVLPVSPETQTWGAVVSGTGGIGKILGGIGELRGE